MSISYNKDWDEMLLKAHPIVEKTYQEPNTLPDKKDVFRAFELTPPSAVRVVIIGQDPYPTRGHADGLAFSTRSEQVPRSLSNIKKVILEDYPDADVSSNSLDRWTKQGVLLLNTALTVEEGNANSHKEYWSDFTKDVLDSLPDDVLFVAWGEQAKKLVEHRPNLITSSHPSPLSFNRGKMPFSKSHMFAKINERLEHKIDWSTGEINEQNKDA